MKKRLCLLLCFAVLLCLHGCGTLREEQSGPISADASSIPSTEPSAESSAETSDALQDAFAVYPVEPTGREIDLPAIECMLYDACENYGTIKQNVPDILTHLSDVTPDDLQGICEIYRFDWKTRSGLDGATFVLCGGKVVPIGYAFGGFGVTGFAYSKDTNVLYFAYSWGSGMHRSHLGMLDLETGAVSDYIDDAFWDTDISFVLSEDGQTLGISRAVFKLTEGGFTQTGEILFEDVTKLEFVPITTE